MRKNWGRWGRGNAGFGKRGKFSTPNSRTPTCKRPSSSSSNIPLDASPYYGWTEFFPDDIYSAETPLARKLRIYSEYFTKLLPGNDELYHQISSKGSVTLSIKELVEATDFTENIPDFMEQLRSTPDITLRSLSLAMYHVLSIAEGGSQSIYSLPLIMVRIADFTPVTPLKDIRANLYGKFITVSGTVVRVSDVKPFVTHLQFNCSVCQREHAHPLKDGKYSLPSPCCGVPLVPCPSGGLTRTIDLQRVRLQEVVCDEVQEAGRIPRTIECELTADLVGSCVPGENALISGVVKVSNGVEDVRTRGNKDKCMFVLYLHVNYVGCSSSLGDGALSVTLSDISAIESLAERFPFGVLVNSLCPTIFGHTLVKAGLILALIGGSERKSSVAGIHKRTDSHVLIVGDPGLGKSQLLQAVSNVAPRGVYVCGNSTSAAGLTVALTKDGHDTVLEAGALVLADQGCCCIDEFDKMSNQHSALLEAMEQQSISIAKAGMVCSLPSRCSIIAAANPIGGHYNPNKTIAENVKLSTPLLSRFDLLFILLDRPDASLDRYLSEHVLALHGGNNIASSSSSLQTWQESDLPLEQKLQCCKEELDPELMRKYIAHVRDKFNPVLGEDAKGVLKEFYLQLRAEDVSDEAPVTTRQLESLVRLTESRAKIAQRSIATADDAIDVIEIVKHCMRDVKGSNGITAADGKCMGVSKAGKLLVSALNKHSDATSTSIFSIPEIKEVMKRARIQVKSFDGLLTALNEQGFLLKKGSNIFQLQTSNCL